MECGVDVWSRGIDRCRGGFLAEWSFWYLFDFWSFLLEWVVGLLGERLGVEGGCLGGEERGVLEWDFYVLVIVFRGCRYWGGLAVIFGS